MIRRVAITLVVLAVACRQAPSHSYGAAITPIIPASWSVPNWYIDPLSAVAACSDSNAGTSSAFPLCTWHQLNDVRWGCQGQSNCPRLAQATTVTWQSNGPVSDVAYARPGIEVGGQLILTAILPSPRCTGTLSGVVLVNRSTPQLTNATICSGAAAGDMLVNSTHSSRAWAFANVSGNTWSFTQPNTPYTVPVVSFPSNHVVNTWVNGDSYTDYPAPVSIYASEASSTPGSNNSTDGAYIVLYQLGVSGQSSNGLDRLRVSSGVYIIESRIQRAVDYDTTYPGPVVGQTLNSVLFGATGGGRNSITQETRPYFVSGQIGQPTAANATFLYGATLDGDIIVSNTPNGVDDGCRTWGEPQIDDLMIGTIYIDTNARLNGDGHWSSAHTIVSGSRIIWGPGGWDITSNGHYSYGLTVPTAVLLNTGVQHLNCGYTACNGGPTGSGSATTVLPSACNIAVTAANIVTNGTLWVPGGASIGPGE